MHYLAQRRNRDNAGSLVRRGHHGKLPNLDRAVLRGGQELLSIRMKRQGGDSTRMGAKDDFFFSSAQVPKTNSFVRASGSHDLPIGADGNGGSQSRVSRLHAVNMSRSSVPP